MLPAVKTRTISFDEFSEERARDHYPHLTRHGARVTNTNGDFMARDYLISQLYQMRSMARSSVRFEIARQNFTTERVGLAENIIVRLRSSNSSDEMPSILLVSHYDTGKIRKIFEKKTERPLTLRFYFSAEFSPGASDDGSGVVTLLEILFNLVNDRTMTFTHSNLIVLFTNAEEIGLDGALSFVKHHPWRDNIRRFINIDSMGSHQKAILSRVKPSQVGRCYLLQMD